MQEFLISVLDILGLAWWVEVKTEAPKCTYYFGPFVSTEAAEAARPGYVEDLQGEGAQNISVVIKRCKPARLTIADDVEDRPGKVSPSFSSTIS